MMAKHLGTVRGGGRMARKAEQARQAVRLTEYTPGRIVPPAVPPRTPRSVPAMLNLVRVRYVEEILHSDINPRDLQVPDPAPLLASQYIA